jgi:hypothetical protein
MAFQLRWPLALIAFGLSLSQASTLASAADVWTLSRNLVSNNTEVDSFDSSGLLKGGFYLHTSVGDLGPQNIADFAFDPSRTLWTLSRNLVSNNTEIDSFDSTGLLKSGFYLHTSVGDLGPQNIADFAFDPSGTLWTLSRNLVSNNTEIDSFDSTGLLTGGFYLHTSAGDLGPQNIAGLAFDPSGTLWTLSRNLVSNKTEVDSFDSSGLLTGGFYLHTTDGLLGPQNITAFAFEPSAIPSAPEPATWSMMMLGFGLVASVGARRQVSAVKRSRHKQERDGDLGARTSQTPPYRRLNGSWRPR